MEHLYGALVCTIGDKHVTIMMDMDTWRALSIAMISTMIGSKSSMPYEIIKAEMATALMVVEALTKSISFLHRLWDLPRHRYNRLALESSR